MPKRQLQELLDRKLCDPNFIQKGRSVTSNHILIVGAELLKMPQTALRDFLNSNFRILLDTKHDLKIAFNNSEELEGFVLPIQSRRNRYGYPILALAIDSIDMEIASSVRHEFGHAMDYINNQGLGFAVRNQQFCAAVKQYLDAKPIDIASRTMRAFPVDRSFRHDHITYYSKFAETVQELAAEMYNKYTYLLHDKGTEAAERFMSEHYLFAWQELKKSVIPQIVESLGIQGLDTDGKPAERLKFDLSIKMIAEADWIEIETSGDYGIEVSVHDWPKYRQDYLTAALQIIGIHCPIVTQSSAQDMQLVIRVVGLDDIDRVYGVIDDSKNSPRAADPVTLKQKFERVLGEGAVLETEIDPKGNLLITVPETYSRRNLEALGIYNTGTLQRINSDIGSVIIIPANHITNSFRDNFLRLTHNLGSIERPEHYDHYNRQIDLNPYTDLALET